MASSVVVRVDAHKFDAAPLKRASILRFALRIVLALGIQN
jgi:hypothetical protein